MNKIKAIIIDDERLAREELRRQIEALSDIEIIGEADNADDAALLIVQLRPDLIFLDIQMPGRSGFELLESLEQVPVVIFTTAYDKFAVKAFDINALDYLVKPIREERFQQAIEKIKIKFTETKVQEPEQNIFIKEGEQYFFIKPSEVYLIESLGNYARLYFKDKKVHVKKSLNQLEKSLNASLFFRINRTEIINTSFIKQVHPLPGNRLTIIMQTGEKLTVSSRQSAQLKNKSIL